MNLWYTTKLRLLRYLSIIARFLKLAICSAAVSLIRSADLGRKSSRPCPSTTRTTLVTATMSVCLAPLYLGHCKNRNRPSRKQPQELSRLLLCNAWAGLSLSLSLCQCYQRASMHLQTCTVIVLHQWLSFDCVMVSNAWRGEMTTKRRNDDSVNSEALRLWQDAADGDWLHLHIWAAAAGASSQRLLLP